MPALYKIFDEILVNAADNSKRDAKVGGGDGFIWGACKKRLFLLVYVPENEQEDTQNDGPWKKVDSGLKYGHFWCLC